MGSLLRCLTGPVIFLVSFTCQSQGTFVKHKEAHTVTPIDFVQTTFVHGLPYLEASQRSVNEIPQLIAILSDRKHEAHWPNAVGILGAIGDDRVIEPLFNFLNRSDDGILSRTHYRAKTNVLMALGYLLHVNNNKAVMDYMIESTTLSAWAKRGTPWESPYHGSQEEMHLELIKKAILGLGLSGRPEAEPVLQAFLQPSSHNVQSVVSIRLKAVAQEALKAHSVIKEVGLAGYYRRAM